MDEVLGVESSDCDDVATAIREGRPLRPSRAYLIEVSDETLSFRAVRVADPVPLGRQILDAANAKPVEEFSLFGLLASGDFEDVRLDETFDLRGRGAERFIYFRTDRTFKFVIDNRQMEWGKPVISGIVLRRLANIQPGYDLFLEVRGGQDKMITDADIVDLSKPGIERFITVIKETTEGLLALPSMDQTYLDQHVIKHEITEDGGNIGVILKDILLPEGKFDHASTDVLILLPRGYPDACPDMFFLQPWVRLKSNGAFPSRADVGFAFGGKQWQRWSRHSNQWRPGIDGLHTMLARFRCAVENAA